MIGLRVVFMTLFFTLFYNLGFSQELQPIPPTPNTAKLVGFQSQKPNLYTGTASVNIPLYTINFDGWNLPLSINYSSNGITTNEEASEVGLGWSLSATGVISRTIRGHDDFFDGGVEGRHKGYVYDTNPITFDVGYEPDMGSTPPDQNSYYAYLVQQKPDTEPDLFNYNFFGYSGTFVLTKRFFENNKWRVNIIKLTEDPTSIQYDMDNSSFIVITPEGFKGTFNYTERSTSFFSTGNVSDRDMVRGEQFIDAQEFKDNSGRFRATTSWYLGKIESPRHNFIYFNYDQGPYLSNQISFLPETFAVVKEPRCIQLVQENIYLNQISSDHVQIDFFFEPREDLRVNTLFTSPSGIIALPESNALKRYTGLKIMGKAVGSKLNKDISFYQNYFNQSKHSLWNDNENELLYLRSRLYKVVIDDQVYRFDYYDNEGLPSKLTLGVDHFGYYNGRDDNTALFSPELTGPGACDVENVGIEYYKQRSERLVDFDKGKAGLLRKVKYPTKGYTEFEYEGHDYMPSTERDFREETKIQKAGGARVSRVAEYNDNGALAMERKYTYRASISDSYGKLMTPLYNRYTRTFLDPSYCKYYYSTYPGITGYGSAQGRLIAYSQVDEIVKGEAGEYKNTYYFE
ncbi:MAG: hypothetical protein OEW75_04140, partial [Cyclobacteriaceae bacterium]|nr:hypothetical protein [Cyclobacteriaceae bacterium]